jgi:hypothetical protein
MSSCVLDCNHLSIFTTWGRQRKWTLRECLPTISGVILDNKVESPRYISSWYGGGQKKIEAVSLQMINKSLTHAYGSMSELAVYFH